jgi:uncharacterized protein
VSGLDELARLGDPACFPHAPAAVKVLQTHLSIVCLAGDLVYKLKKPVTLPFVDFSTLPSRRQACRDEVRLNGRLCPDTYLGTASLRRSADGSVRFAALGDDDGDDDVDVAVVMRRLPQERMLDELLRTRSPTPAGGADELATALADLARHLAEFHARAERSPAITAIGDPRQLAAFAAANFTELAALPHRLPPALLAAVADASRREFQRILPTMQTRAAAGRVVDGHGDLHARNVCMTAPPTVYDCIEFEPRFRIGDVATEIAFLVMDLRYRGASDLARSFTAAYGTASGDHELHTLLPTLCAYRAMVRAKVAVVAAAAPELAAADRDHAVDSAHRHLQLAAALLAEAGGPWWLVIFGPPASGKSTLAAALATSAGWPRFATDVVRKRLAGLAPTERGPAAIYSEQFTHDTYRELQRQAMAATAAGERVVLLDGNFPSTTDRHQVAANASAAGARCLFVHVDLDRATAIARAAARASDGQRISDADAAVAATRHDAFARPTAAEAAAQPTVVVDGTQPPLTQHDAVLVALLTAADNRDH